jgi:hypothetical protein
MHTPPHPILESFLETLFHSAQKKRTLYLPGDRVRIRRQAVARGNRVSQNGTSATFGKSGPRFDNAGVFRDGNPARRL